MTGPERLELRELRQEMRESFKEVKAAIQKVSDRVAPLETKAEVETALSADGDRRKSDQRWRLSLVFGIATSVGLGILNLILNSRPG